MGTFVLPARDGGVRPTPVATPRFARLLTWVCVLTFFANVVHWGTLFPINSVPDEQVRFFMVEHLWRFGHWPGMRGPERPFVGALSGFHYFAKEWWYHGLPNLDVVGAWHPPAYLRVQLHELRRAGVDRQLAGVAGGAQAGGRALSGPGGGARGWHGDGDLHQDLLFSRTWRGAAARLGGFVP